MQAYLNQEFPLGVTDLRLHPVRAIEDPTSVPDDALETEAWSVARPCGWWLALARPPWPA